TSDLESRTEERVLHVRAVGSSQNTSSISVNRWSQAIDSPRIDVGEFSGAGPADNACSHVQDVSSRISDIVSYNIVVSKFSSSCRNRRFLRLVNDKGYES